MCFDLYDISNQEEEICREAWLSHFPPNADVLLKSSTPSHGNATVVMLLLRRAQAYSDTSALACGGRCTCVEVAEEEFCWAATLCPAYSEGVCGAARRKHNTEEGSTGDKYSSPTTIALLWGK